MKLDLNQKPRSTMDLTICRIFQLEYNDHIDVVDLLMEIKYEREYLIRERDLAKKELECTKELVEFLKDEIKHLRERNG